MHNCPHTKAKQQKSSPSAAEELDELTIDDSLVISADIDTSAHSKFHRPILVVEFWGGARLISLDSILFDLSFVFAFDLI